MAMPDIDTLPPLEPPFEILELQPCTPVYLKVVDWKIGTMTISPRYPGAPPLKKIIAIRLYVDPATKKYFPPYYDITPSRLVHFLAGFLTGGLPKNMWLKIHRDVPGPSAHYEVTWVTAPP